MAFDGLIFAGGRGSRMDASVPKPLVRVGGVALIEHCVRLLVRAGGDALGFALGHRAEEIRAGVEPALPAGVEARWFVEERPLGTIGALRELARGRTTVTINGDVWTDLDVGSLLEAHRSGRADLTIATHVQSIQLELGEVVADSGGAVIEYREKPTKSFDISSGIYCFEPTVPRLIREGEALGIPELVRRAIDAGLVVRRCAHDAAWIDVNDAALLREAERIYGAHRARFSAAKTRGNP